MKKVLLSQVRRPLLGYQNVDHPLNEFLSHPGIQGHDLFIAVVIGPMFGNLAPTFFEVRKCEPSPARLVFHLRKAGDERLKHLSIALHRLPHYFRLSVLPGSSIIR
jgi:hypothetical protein